MGNGDTVLIVEDDPDIREMLGEVLETEGFVTVLAAHGLEAMGVLTSRPLPQLIILDLGMPVMNGAQFREWQLSDPVFARIPVVVISADSIGKMTAQSLGVEAYLQKPIDRAALLTLARDLGSNVGAGQ